MNRRRSCDIRALPLSACCSTWDAGSHAPLSQLALGFLLRPLGASLPLRRLLPISSVGFMAILALPIGWASSCGPTSSRARARPDERGPRHGRGRADRRRAVLSILFFVSSSCRLHDGFSPELRFGAWLSLLLFVGLTTFLALAQVWTERPSSWRCGVRCCAGSRRRAPSGSASGIRSVISGFQGHGRPAELRLFLVQSIALLGANGFGMWMLRGQMGLPISFPAALTTMAVTGVVLSLPNSPGLVGQFHAGDQARAVGVPSARGRQLERHRLRDRPARDPDPVVRRHRDRLLAGDVPSAAGRGRVAGRGGAGVQPRRRGRRAPSRPRPAPAPRARTWSSRDRPPPGREARSCPCGRAGADGRAGRAAGARAGARNASLVPYPTADVWPAAVRFLRVDRDYQLKEKDEAAGYILFDIPRPSAATAGRWSWSRPPTPRAAPPRSSC